MKKITLTVASLALAISGFSINPDSVQVKQNQLDLVYMISDCEDMIEWIKWDVENGKIYQEYADLYIESLLNIMSKAEDLIENINKK